MDNPDYHWKGIHRVYSGSSSSSYSLDVLTTTTTTTTPKTTTTTTYLRMCHCIIRRGHLFPSLPLLACPVQVNTHTRSAMLTESVSLRSRMRSRAKEKERSYPLDNRFGVDIVRSLLYLNSANNLHGGLFMRNHKAT